MDNESTSTFFAKTYDDELDGLQYFQNPTLRWILGGVDSQFENRIAELKGTWNRKIRSFYRDVLSVSTKNAPIRAVFKLDNQGQFGRLIEENFPDLDFSEFIALRRFLQECTDVEPYFQDFAEFEALSVSRDFAVNRLTKYDLNKIIRTLFLAYKGEPGMDLFGSYDSSDHHVEIYLIPSIVFSILIEEDYFDFIINTLSHELAHGMQHVGEDKDGATWESFRRSDLDLVEGLAEYYSREFARSVSRSKPSVLSTFKKTAPYLPACYTRYEEWDESITLETIYQSFIEARRTDLTSYGEFSSLLRETKTRLDPNRN